MRKHSRARRSRRALPLKDSDYDHEIALVDHVAGTPTPPAISPQQTNTTSLQTVSQSGPEAEAEPRPSSSSRRAPSGTHTPRRSTTSTSTESKKSKKSNKSSSRSRSRGRSPGKAVIPTVQVNREHFPPFYSAGSLLPRGSSAAIWYVRMADLSRTHADRRTSTCCSHTEGQPTQTKYTRVRRRCIIRK